MSGDNFLGSVSARVALRGGVTLLSVVPESSNGGGIVASLVCLYRCIERLCCRGNGAALAKFRDGRCKADETTIAASLRGNWRGEHLFALQQALARHDLLQGQIEACEARIDAELDGQAPGGAANEPSPARRARESVVRERLHRMLGADLTAIPTVGVETALTVAAETRRPPRGPSPSGPPG